MSYAVIRTEPALWTVGFTKPDGSWEAESDHGSEREARRRAHELNGIEFRFVYLRSEPRLWTAGEYSGTTWYAESDHGSTAEAAARVMELNA